MLRFIAGRLANIAVQVSVIATAVFALFRMAPGDPAALILGANATQSQVDVLREQMGLNQPIFVQFIEYLQNLVQGDLGISSSYSQPVMTVIMSRVDETAALLILSLLIATSIGLVGGVMAAVRPRSFFWRGTLLLWVLLLAVPNFWFGMLLIQLFAVKLQWLPAYGSAGMAGLILPAIAVSARLVALIARLTRAAMLEILGEDFIRTANSRGVSPVRLILVHALKPAFPSVLVLIGLQAGYLFGGAVVVENLFSYPGMGQLLLAAVSQRDYTLMQGITIFFVAGFLIINLCVDIVSSRIDPRIQIQRAKA
ncbi:MAG TPA: ABC transporter permease [Candidatus Paceibacterota bacterium]|nr:ABC transporter permease [Candidatus Paceibacterota bacterium]